MKKPAPLNILYVLALVQMAIATAVAQLPWLAPYSAPVYVPVAEYTFMLSQIGPWWQLVRQRGHRLAALVILLLGAPPAWWLAHHYTTGKPAFLLLVPLTVVPSLVYFFFMLRFRPQSLDERSRFLMPMIVFMSALFLCVASMLRATVICEPVLDLTIAAFQAQLGLAGFEAAVRHAFPWSWDLTVLVTTVYSNILPASMIMLLTLRQRPALVYFIAWVSTAIIGYFTYWLIPAVGPTVASQYFPEAFTTPSADVYVYASGLTEIRNAIPSLHVVWGLLLILFARRFSWLSFLGVCAFAATNILGTISTGSHWLSDLFASAPLMAIGLYLGSYGQHDRYDRLGALIATASLVLIVIGLRFAPDFLIAFAPACAAYLVASAVFSLAVCWRLTNPARWSDA